ncbi:MAG TPA: PH domain-containing protein [Actinomycetospora sp.]|nr:PH domain-containing protein [Actinomycetospora sp.]
MAYPDAVLRRGEHVLAHRRPHWRMLVVPALVPPAAAFLAAFLAALATTVPSDATRTALQLALVLLAVLAVAWLAVLPLVRWRCTHLVVTDRRLLVREGVLARESVDVAGATITGVRTRCTGLERALGAGTLVVATAGTEEPWEFSGLARVERLATMIEGVAADRGGLDRAVAAGPGDRDEDLEEELEEELEERDDDLEEELEGDGDPEPVPAGGRVRRWRSRRSRAARTSR